MSGKYEDDFDALTGYEPTRPARLRAPDAEPPPLPPPASIDPEGFGRAHEDGLRMLAALETLTSLEPDFSDDLMVEEASVTIIESAGEDVIAGAFAAEPFDARPLRRLLHDDDAPAPAPALLLNGYETFLAPGEEAMVEIVEVTHGFDNPQPMTDRPIANPTSLAERISAATGRNGRFFKALSGG